MIILVDFTIWLELQRDTSFLNSLLASPFGFCKTKFYISHMSDNVFKEGITNKAQRWIKQILEEYFSLLYFEAQQCDYIQLSEIHLLSSIEVMFLFKSHRV